MNENVVDRVPEPMPEGFFMYEATAAEKLCHADKSVIEPFGCETMATWS